LIVAVVVAAALALAVDDGPCTTPRRAAATILGNLAPPVENPDALPEPAAVRRAVRCVDVPRGMDEATLRTRLATLQDTLDAVGVVVRPADIPDDANHLDPRTFRASVVLSPQAPRIRLQKNDAGEWRLPADAVADADDIHDDVVGIDLGRFARRLPAPWHRSFFGVTPWQGLGLLVLLGLALALRFLLGAIVTRRLSAFARLKAWRLSVDELRSGARPLGWVIACVAFGALVPMLGLPARWTARLLAVDRVVAAVCLVWLALRVVDLSATHLEERARGSPSRMDDHLVPLTRRIVKMLLVLLGGVLALQSFGIDVGSLVAGLGIGGLAVALAAKDTIGNFFGSVAIFLDRPFQIGDWVATTNGAVEGTVESVGFRSTQIRTIGDTVVTVPNARMADADVNNFGARRHRRVRLTIAFNRDATAAQLDEFTTTVRARLLALPPVKTDAVDVVAHDFTETAIVVLVHFYIDAKTWTDELRLRHEAILVAVEVAHTVGLRLALPARAPVVEAAPPPPTTTTTTTATATATAPASTPTTTPSSTPKTASTKAEPA
jgi:MscS family membrane protein